MHPIRRANPADAVPVIAIGTDRPARDALLRLLDTMPQGIPAVCILFDTADPVPTGPGAAGPLTLDWLGRRGAVWAEHGMQLRPGTLLIAPLGAAITIAGDRLVVEPGQGPHALDAFVLSLARSPCPGVLVMLSGPKFSGALGAAALRAHGGLALAAVDGGDGLVPWPAHDERPLRTIPAEIEAHLLRHARQDEARLPECASFFDAAGELDGLRSQLLPSLLRGKGEAARLRVWVAGCGTGEAVYSLAIALLESLGEAAIPLQVFATDVDRQALAAARAGRFGEAIAGQVSPARLERWFVRRGAAYIVRPELRELCIFSAHNILRDPPFSRMDIIWSGGVLDQIGPSLQDHVLRTLHFALNPGGALRLAWRRDAPADDSANHPANDGGADQPGASAWFEPLAQSPHLFRRRPKPEPPAPQRPPGRETVPALTRWRDAASAAMMAEAERIAASHGPPFVVVDASLDVLHFSARMGRFLAPTPGEATLNLLGLVHVELRTGLEDLLRRAALTGEPVQSGRLAVGGQAGRLTVTLAAKPMTRAPNERRHVLVMFQDGIDDAEPALLGPALLSPALLSDASSGPALGLAREELQTSREEFRSLHEEFQGVNTELAARITDLARANSDMRNVLESTRIAIVFLDNHLLLQSFTPAAADVAQLGDSTIGEPVDRLVLRVDYPGLVADARHVLRSLATLEREVGGAGGRRYLVRLLPYRRIDDFIGGVVVTFFDITATFAAECAMRDSEERFRMMAEIVPAFLFIAGPDGGWQYVNPPFYAFTGLAAAAALGEGWWQAVHAEDLEASRHAWQTALQAGAPVEIECRLCRAQSEESWFLLRAVPKFDALGRTEGWYGSCTDIDARRRAGRRQRQLLSELQHRVKNILAVVRSVVVRTVDASTSVDDLSAHLSGRISAIARIQGVISRNAGDAVVLSELVDEELAAHGGQIDSQTEVDGPTVLLTDKVAEGLGLALHELTTNAIKYGALSLPSGRLRIQWRLYPIGLADPLQQRLMLEWQESGVPVTDLDPGRHGFGRELLETGLPYELGASTSLNFRPGGIRWAMQLAIAQ